MDTISQNHTFVVCAYEENPYLEKCVQSVVNQSVKSQILISTSTPNEYIDRIAKKYKLEVRVNEGKGDQADNFNFAYACCNTKFVTLCHQDDYYAKHYLREIEKALQGVKMPIIVFTDYAEVRHGAVKKTSLVLIIKRLMLLPLRIRRLQESKFLRRRLLGFGNPICCPAITYNKDILKKVNFCAAYTAIDYEMLERISKQKGSFVYCSRRLVFHRQWEGTETQLTIDSGQRSIDEQKIMARLWPACLARIFAKIYKIAQRYY